MTEYVYAIDPGTTKSGVVLVPYDKSCKLLRFGKIWNEDVLREIRELPPNTEIVFEKFAPQSTIGATTVDAIVWYGRMIQEAGGCGHECHHIFRRDVKKHLIGKFVRANGSADSQIRKALVARFATHDDVNGKGTKDNPDWFYGVSTTDVYAAYAVAVTFIDEHFE